MDRVWVLVGAVVLLGTLLDVFLTALNYDESGIVAGRVQRTQWRLLRVVTRRLPRRWRPLGLRQVTGLQIVVIVAVWLFGVILGFGLVYYGLMSPTSFSASGTDARLDLFGAMYFSAAQLSTVGGSYLTAETDVLRFLSIAETLTGVILVSLILTFLLGVYSVISDLNALCRHFLSTERGAGSPTASLAPYFRDGQVSGLDGHLDGIASSFASYTDGLRLHHAAYYFQSGRDQFALPYAIRMLGGTLGALRWGLPAGHPAATAPALVPLTFQFLEFGDDLQNTLRWESVDVPGLVSRDEFAAQVAAPAHGGRRDEWVERFVQLDRDMSRIAGLAPSAGSAEAYDRYAAWLPFAYRAQQVALAVSRDLDYQPVIVSDHPVSLLRADDALALRTLEGEVYRPDLPPRPADDESGGRAARWRRSVGNRLSLVDPGYARLRAATRALVAAVGAVVTLFVAFDALDVDAAQPAIYGGFVAMLSTGVAVDATVRARKVTSVLVLLPVAVVVLLGALASDSPGWTGVLLVVVALTAVWVGRFGPRWAALGQATFMAYYFALLLRLHLSDVLLYVGAAAVGVVWAYVLNFVLMPERPRQVLREGLDAYEQHIVTSLDSLVDAVSWARWDPDVRRRVSTDVRQRQGAAALLGGQLTAPRDVIGIDPVRAGELRLRLFDTELAATGLVAAARGVTGATLSLELRARLAGRLELLQAHLAQLTAPPVGRTPPTDAMTAAGLAAWVDERPPAGWPRAATSLSQSADELYRAVGALQEAAQAAFDPDAPPVEPDPDRGPGDDGALDELQGVTVAPADPSSRSGLSATSRRAVQAAVATGTALGIGEAVSSTHQYWATLAAFQVLGGTDGETFVKGVRRIGGTVAGAAVGFGIALWTGGDLAVVAPLLALSVFASTYYQRVSQSIATFWRTTLFALVYESLGRLTSQAVEIRVLETVAGAVIALVVAWVVLPTRTRTQLNRDAAALVRDVDVVVTAALERVQGNDAVSRQALQTRLLTIDREVRQVGTTAAPLRRSAGSWEPGGIESTWMALWSLAYFSRQIVRAVERAVDDGVRLDPADWERARRATSTNLAALGAALADRVPGPVEEDLDLVGQHDHDAPADRAAQELLRQVERINLTVLVLVADLAPGSVSAERAGVPVAA